MNKGSKVVFAMLATVFLTGCAQLPRFSEIKAGPEVQRDITGDYLYYSPSGPSAGESQQEILNGFINAGTGLQNDYEAAREYLARDFKTKWKPNSEVLIQQGRPAISFNTKQNARVSLKLQATVDADGHFKIMDPASTRLLRFEMVRERGEWRISSAPNLTILTRPVFDVIFRSYSIYFFDVQKKHLVPDLRWFPSRASTGTRMINAMLKGPSEWLKSAVVSAIPAGTALSLNSVTVADGVAAVDLNARALTAKPATRQLMKAQIRATLTQLPNVYSVNILVERGLQEIADLPDFVPTPASGTAVILRSGELEILSESGTTPIDGTASLIAKTGATDFAITASQEWVALKSSAGIYRSHLGLFGSNPVLVDSRVGQLAPSFDPQGYLWTMTRKEGELIQITSPTGHRQLIELGWLSTFPRRQFAISAEGSRIALLVGSGTSAKVFVLSIIRDGAGKPTGFGMPLEIVRSGSSPSSVSWGDENTLAVLQAKNKDAVGASFFTISGASRDLGSLGNARTLEARNSISAIFALDSEKSLYQRQNSSWVRTHLNIDAMHFVN